MLNPNKEYYKDYKRSDDEFYIRGVYDRITGKGVEQIFKLHSESEIDKSNEMLEDIYRYQE
jgi:hypothetical protein